MNKCNCGTWDRGDLRAVLFMAACPVHMTQIFGKPEPPQVKPKRCGDCSFWMKSSLCPEERNVNGWNKGPSMNGVPCSKFQDAAYNPPPQPHAAMKPTPPSEGGGEEMLQNSKAKEAA